MHEQYIIPENTAASISAFYTSLAGRWTQSGFMIESFCICKRKITMCHSVVYGVSYLQYSR